MQTVQMDGREFTVTEVLPLDTALKAMCADLVARGFEAQTYILKGKRGATVTALRSIKTGLFSKLY